MIYKVEQTEAEKGKLKYVFYFIKAAILLLCVYPQAEHVARFHILPISCMLHIYMQSGSFFLAF